MTVGVGGLSATRLCTLSQLTFQCDERFNGTFSIYLHIVIRLINHFMEALNLFRV